MVYSRYQEVNGLYYHTSRLSSVTTSDGSFTTNYVATWDGTEGSDGWSQMDGSATTGVVRGMRAYSAERVYAFGDFTVIGGVSVGSVALWNGTEWSALGAYATTNAFVNDVAYDADNDLLYAVGDFTSIYGVGARGIAVFDGSSWSELGYANDEVYACELDGDNNLYVAGIFSTIDGVVFGTSRFMRYNYALASWETPYTSWSGTPRSVRYDSANNTLYVVGSMTSVDGIANTELMVRYDIAEDTFESVGDFTDASDSIIHSVMIRDGNVYIGESNNITHTGQWGGCATSGRW